MFVYSPLPNFPGLSNPKRGHGEGEGGSTVSYSKESYLPPPSTLAAGYATAHPILFDTFLLYSHGLPRYRHQEGLDTETTMTVYTAMTGNGRRFTPFL